MKTTVEIPDSLFKEVKTYASAKGLSFRQVVESGLRQVLRADPVRSRPFRLRKHPFRGRGLASEADWPSIRRRIYEGRGE